MRILMVHASTRGATTALAVAMAHELRGRGFEVTTVAAADRPDPARYDAVVVGGALYRGRWHPAATAYTSMYAATLRTVPVYLFSSGPIDDSADLGALAPLPQVARIAKDLEVRGHHTFGGSFIASTAGLRDRIWARGRHGDFRDQGQVEEWAHRITVQLTPTGLTAPDVVAQAVPRQRSRARSAAATR